MHTHDELVMAVKAGDAATVTKALGAGASLDERDARGHTALMLACERGDVAVTGALLEAGASPNRRTLNREETVLHQLARRPGSDELVKLVLQHRCRVDRRDRFGWTPLMVAAQVGATEVASALLQAGADVTVQAPDGRSVRDLAGDNEGMLAALG